MDLREIKDLDAMISYKCINIGIFLVKSQNQAGNRPCSSIRWIGVRVG
jgi:hypothetical protein